MNLEKPDFRTDLFLMSCNLIHHRLREKSSIGTNTWPEICFSWWLSGMITRGQHTHLREDGVTGRDVVYDLVKAVTEYGAPSGIGAMGSAIFQAGLKSGVIVYTRNMEQVGHMASGRSFTIQGLSVPRIAS